MSKVIGYCPHGFGARIKPNQGAPDFSMLGFTVGDRVQIIGNEPFFTGWHGHVRNFNNDRIAVDLDEPPSGHKPNGQWFDPKNLRLSPKNE